MLEDIRARAKRVIEDEDGERQRYLAIKANERKQQTEDESRLLKQAESRLAELDTIISKTYEERMLASCPKIWAQKCLKSILSSRRNLQLKWSSTAKQECRSSRTNRTLRNSFSV